MKNPVKALAVFVTACVCVYLVSLVELREDEIGRMPDLVEQMVEAEFPADGQFHVQAVGKFNIEPDTFFCTYRPGYGLSGSELNDALEDIGQSTSTSGLGLRANGSIGRHSSKKCIGDSAKHAIFVKGFLTTNRKNNSYRLVHAIWQGSAAWIAGIERSDGVRPGTSSAVRHKGLSKRKGLERIEASISGDNQELTILFANNVVRKSERKGLQIGNF